MDKYILEQYIDACVLVEEAEAELRKLKKQRKTIQHAVVKGSSHEFPYTPKNFHMEGIAYSIVKDPGKAEEQERILQQRIDEAAKIKLQVESWMLTIPQRMQRIVQYRFFDELSWGQIAIRMGRKATADGIKMEFRRFMENN